MPLSRDQKDEIESTINDFLDAQSLVESAKEELAASSTKLFKLLDSCYGHDAGRVMVKIKSNKGAVAKLVEWDGDERKFTIVDVD